MKSLDPLDPKRLNVKNSTVSISPWSSDGAMRVEVTFLYEPWWADDGQDVLWEQSNALMCLRAALERGGVTENDS